MAKLSVVMTSQPLSLKEWMDKNIKDIPGLGHSEQGKSVLIHWFINDVEFWVHQNRISILASKPTKVRPQEIQNLLDLYESYLEEWPDSEDEIEVTVHFVASK